MKRVALTCPKCGAPLRFKEALRTCRCEYCGNDVLAVEFAFSIGTKEEPSGAVEAGADFVVEGTVLIEYIGQGGDVVVPERITDIAPQAFQGTAVETVVLPSSLRKIGQSAFENCGFLESISIPEGVAVVENGTFSGCVNLEAVKLPSTLVEIEDSAFEDCSSLESIVVPEGVVRLGFWVFRDCDSLEKVTLPSTITYLSEVDGAFDGCCSLEQVSCCIDFNEHEDWEIEGVFGDAPVLETIRRRCGRCIWCGDDAEPGSETCESCS